MNPLKQRHLESQLDDLKAEIAHRKATIRRLELKVAEQQGALDEQRTWLNDLRLAYASLLANMTVGAAPPAPSASATVEPLLAPAPVAEVPAGRCTRGYDDVCHPFGGCGCLK